MGTLRLIAYLVAGGITDGLETLETPPEYRKITSRGCANWW